MIGLVKADGLNFLREKSLSYKQRLLKGRANDNLSRKKLFFLILTVKRKKDNSDVESVH